jgi:hypothetical protein
MHADDNSDTDAQYAELELADSTVIYDRGNHRAWLQSDSAVGAEAMT